MKLPGAACPGLVAIGGLLTRPQAPSLTEWLCCLLALKWCLCLLDAGRKWFLNDVHLSDVFIILLLWLKKERKKKKKGLNYQQTLAGLQLTQQLPSP